MTKYTAQALGEAIMAATFSTTIAKTKTFELPMADFPINAILTMLAHGAQRKFNDAVGGADKSAETKVEMAAAMIAEYKDGVVSKRREAAAGVTVEVAAGRKIMRGLVPQILNAEQVKTFRALTAAEQNAKLDEWVDANREALADEIAKEVKRLEDERKAKGKLSAAVAIAI